MVEFLSVQKLQYFEIKVLKQHFIFLVRDFLSLKIIFEIAGAFLVFFKSA